jgi:hypothetical protein
MAQAQKPTGRKSDRGERLAAKLRENLKKRKQQNRARRGGEGVGDQPEATGPSKD